MMTTVLKFKSESGREIFFEPEKTLPNNFIEAKKYLNSVFILNGRFESYAFNLANVTEASQEEKDMYQQMKDHSIHLIAKT